MENNYMHTCKDVTCGCLCKYCAYCYNGCPQCGKGYMKSVTTSTNIDEIRYINQ